ncbi:MAG: hypothetical protein A2150_05905 [Candidatus Muproteobacteria bacterium RBG_16_64_11]|uniref:SpoVT-AbrB domain-containing protein n=1 Tax=Candidatus Muproteobacteria bacterium RBG_16_64_11 TaxID=1817758 RepID=A0A1F6TIA1_9PROT|nr:MAG: hypothetical protein A2150_05905 [Candidatus Muproteobacteria bacterium RBG_16_64_11]
MSKVSLRKIGSNYVTTIPSELVRELHLKSGSKFEVTKENGRLVLTPITPELEAVIKAHDKVPQKYRAAFHMWAV